MCYTQDSKEVKKELCISSAVLYKREELIVHSTHARKDRKVVRKEEFVSARKRVSRKERRSRVQKVFLLRESACFPPP